MFIILKGENGLKFFKWVGVFEGGKAFPLLPCSPSPAFFFLRIVDSSAVFFPYPTNLKHIRYEEASSCSLQTLVLVPISTLSVFCSAVV